MIRVLYFAFLTFLAVACGPSSLDEYRQEGGEKIVSLLKQFETVHNREQLLQRAPQITRLFNELADLIIAAKEFKELHRQADLAEPGQRTSGLSKRLREEIERLYRIDGCREIVEKCQEEALFRVDTFEKRLQAGKK